MFFCNQNTRINQLNQLEIMETSRIPLRSNYIQSKCNIFSLIVSSSPYKIFSANKRLSMQQTNCCSCRVQIVFNSTETKNQKESRAREEEEVGQRLLSLVQQRLSDQRLSFG